MIVALNAQGDCDAVSGVDNAGVLSWTDQNVLAFGGQSGKKRP
jgi:carboxylesterase type B